MKASQNVAYLDCFSGISGDMFLGALLHAGLDEQHLRNELDKLGLDPFELTITRKKVQSIEAIKIDVLSKGKQEFRTLSTILSLFEESTLQKATIEAATKVFTLLAEAEAEVHGLPVEKIHFHEVGALDTIVDIVGAVIGLQFLKVDTLICSPLPMGRGFVHCAHGKLPLPAPAVCNILKNIPTYGVEIEKELVTPTGAALVKGLVDGFSSMPVMSFKATGYGAGSHELPDNQPNLLRLILGEKETVQEAQEVEILETNLDDWAPEGFQFLCKKLLQQHALDVNLTPIQMKKGRPGFRLQVICKSQDSKELSQIILSETTAIGLRYRTEKRITLPRKIVTIKTSLGEIKAKQVETPKGSMIYPEYEECLKVAEKHNIPLQQVYRAVMQENK